MVFFWCSSRTTNALRKNYSINMHSILHIPAAEEPGSATNPAHVVSYRIDPTVAYFFRLARQHRCVWAGFHSAIFIAFHLIDHARGYQKKAEYHFVDHGDYRIYYGA
jgi:hypothetical protein